MSPAAAIVSVPALVIVTVPPFVVVTVPFTAYAVPFRSTPPAAFVLIAALNVVVPLPAVSEPLRRLLWSQLRGDQSEPSEE